MQEEIIACFNLIHKPNNSNEEISQGTEHLKELAESPEFIPALLEISNSVPDKTFKLAAIIQMCKEIPKHYDDIAEIHQALYEIIPQFVSILGEESLALIMNYSSIVIENALKAGELENIITDIQTFVSSPETLSAGLVVAVSLSEFISAYENAEGELSRLAVPFIEFICAFIDQTEDEVTLAYIFMCINNLLMNTYIQYFNENFGAFQPILVKLMFLERAEVTPQYQLFSKNAADFLVIFLSKYYGSVDGDFLGTMVTLIKNVIASGNLIPYVKADVLKALYTLIKINGFYENFMQENAEEWFGEIFFPLFAVSVEDLATAISDPKTFTDELHKSSEDFNDFRETAVMIIKYLSTQEQNDSVRELVFGILIQKIEAFGASQQEDQDLADLFAAAHFFSSAADSFGLYCKPLLNRLINEVSPLFESDNEIVRASGYLMLARVHADLQMPIVIQCIHGTVDDSHLVRYYAMSATANLLEKADDSSAEGIQEEFSESVEELMTAFIETCNEFEDPEVKRTLTQIVRFFGEFILPFASQVCHEFITMIAQSGQQPQDDEDAFDNALTVNQSLANLVELVSGKSDESNDFAQEAFMLCIEALQQMTNECIVDAFLETVYQILECCSTFVPDFWGITEAIVPHYSGNDGEDYSIGACCEIFSLLLYKDTEFASRPEICGPVVEFILAKMQEKMSSPDSWNELAKVCEGLLCRLPADSPILQQCFPTLCEMTFQQLTTTNTLINDIEGAVLLLNSLLINNFAGVEAVLGENFQNLLGLWVQWPAFPETCVAVMTNAEVIAANPDLQLSILNATIMQLFDDILTRSEDDDEFDQDVDKEGAVWFDFGDTLNQFYAFLNQIQETNPPLFESIKSSYDEDEFNDLVRIPKIAELYIKTRDEKTK